MLRFVTFLEVPSIHTTYRGDKSSGGGQGHKSESQHQVRRGDLLINGS